jgi:cysteine-rich repeat protein
VPSPGDLGPRVDGGPQSDPDGGPVSYCGDRVLRQDLRVGDPGFEECDDGNNRAGDGCSPTCQIEGLPPLHCVEVPGRDRRTSFCRSRRGYAAAQRACRLQAGFIGDLVTVLDAADNALIVAVLRRNQEGRGWIGLNDRAIEGELDWLGRVSPFRNWQAGNSRNDAVRDCTVIRLDNERWQVSACGDENPFVCEERNP